LQKRTKKKRAARMGRNLGPFFPISSTVMSRRKTTAISTSDWRRPGTSLRRAAGKKRTAKAAATASHIITTPWVMERSSPPIWIGTSV
jgi:hypothetical protein